VQFAESSSYFQHAGEVFQGEAFLLKGDFGLILEVKVNDNQRERGNCDI
jgi:hypothetical protein